MSTNNIVLVDNETSLNILNTFLSSLGEDKNVSVDTEFTRTKTYYPILDLVQICIDDTKTMTIKEISNFVLQFSA